MAVLNIRVDDRVRDQLKEMADDEGVTPSEYVRDLLMEAVVPVYEREVEHGDEPPAESMRIVDRQVLSLLHRILGRVLPEDANDVDGDLEYQLMRAKILEEGYTGEYWYETAGFRTELSKRDCSRCPTSSRCSASSPTASSDLDKEGTPSTRSSPASSSSGASTTTTRWRATWRATSSSSCATGPLDRAAAAAGASRPRQLAHAHARHLPADAVRSSAASWTAASAGFSRLTTS